MKKTLVTIIIGLFVMIPVMSNLYDEITTPDKVLVVGHSMNKHTVEFKKEIKNQGKIAEYENILEELVFTRTGWEPKHYPDYILKIDHLKEGISTGFTYIWFDGDEGIIFIPSTPSENFAKLTSEQVEILKEIIE